MGTNYYHRSNICSCCRRYDETHICKSMVTFEAVVEWREEPNDGTQVVTVGSWQQWKERILAGGEVWDEYGEKWDTEKFIERVENVPLEHRRRQYEWCVEHGFGALIESSLTDGPEPMGEWLDADGFSFSGREFS